MKCFTFKPELIAALLAAISVIALVGCESLYPEDEKENAKPATGNVESPQPVALRDAELLSVDTSREASVSEAAPDETADATKDAEASEEEYDGPYLIQTGDKLEISVLDEPEMTREVSVIPDGTITYLLVGELDAEGKTLKQVRDEISKALEEYFIAPKVSVLLQELHKDAVEKEEEEKKVYASALGALKNPGKYEIEDGDRLLDLIAKSGGFLYINDFAGGRRIANLKASYISRDGKKLPVDFYQLVDEGDMSQNVTLKPHDFVFIANPESQIIYVMGEVASPQRISYNRDISLVEALAQSGGFTENAQRSRVMVIRGMNEKDHLAVDVESLLLGDPDERNVKLASGDIVFVPEQGLSEYSRYARYLTDLADLVISVYQVRETVRWPRLHRRDTYP